MCRSSSTSSKLAESEAPGVQIGNRRSRSPRIRSESSSASRARIQLRLPITVLISPLWAMNRNGCASGQRGGHPLVGEVGVEGVELCGGQHALVEQGATAQGGEVGLRLVFGPLAQA